MCLIKGLFLSLKYMLIFGIVAGLGGVSIPFIPFKLGGCIKNLPVEIFLDFCIDHNLVDELY